MFGRRKKPTAEAAPVRPKFGWPGTCPACGREGYLDHIDMAAHRSRSRCRCSAVWVMVEAPDGSAMQE